MERRLWYSATTVGVTPSEHVPLAGYVARGDQPATGTHDPLTASLLWLSDESSAASVCWVALDALSVDARIAGRLRAAVGAALGLPADTVLVCCSHTHAAPRSWSGEVLTFASGDPSTVDESLVDRLVSDIGRGAARLPALRAPVRAVWGQVDETGLGSNRYRTTGPHETSTGVLTLHDQQGAVVAVLFDYACHPTVLGATNREYSADFPAATRRVVAAGLRETYAVETPPVTVFLQGAAGDASTRFTRREQTFGEVNRLGGILAGAVLRGVLDSDDEPVAEALPVVRRATVRVPTRRLPTLAQAKAELVAAEADWHATHATHGADSPTGRIARTRFEGAQILVSLCEAGVPAAFDLPVTVVALGDVAWVHLPVEPFASWSARIRADSPFGITRLIGYTDGYFGYLPDESAFADGGYEALSSLFDPAGGEELVRHVNELVRAVADIAR